jgi:hypothetical protein
MVEFSADVRGWNAVPTLTLSLLEDRERSVA